MNLLPLPPAVATFLTVHKDRLHQQRVASQHVPQDGPGTEFAKITKALKIPLCGLCSVTLAWMNQLGCNGCEQNFDAILAALRTTAEAIRKDWEKKSLASKIADGAVMAYGAVTDGIAFKVNPLDPLPGMLREAIRRARTQELAKAKE